MTSSYCDSRKKRGSWLVNYSEPSLKTKHASFHFISCSLLKKTNHLSSVHAAPYHDHFCRLRYYYDSIRALSTADPDNMFVHDLIGQKNVFIRQLNWPKNVFIRKQNSAKASKIIFASQLAYSAYFWQRGWCSAHVCWKKLDLTEISSAFRVQFLVSLIAKYQARHCQLSET